MIAELQWFAIRTIFQHVVAGNKAIYEEKITIFRAESANAAIKLAEHDLSAYLEMNGSFVAIKRYDVYELGHNKHDLNGSEVWSHLNKGPADPEQYYRERYEEFEE